MSRAPSALAALLAAASAAPSEAQSTEAFEREVDLRLADAPTTFLDVVDAFEDDDPLDVDVRFGFERELARGVIEREVGAPGAWRRVALHRRFVSTLRLGLDVGLHTDLALRLRVPIVLSDVRRLTSPGGTPDETVRERLTALDPTAPGPDGVATARPLFEVPFASDERSGIPHVELGLAWSPTTGRAGTRRPTVVLIADARLAVSEPMRACARDVPADAPEGATAPCRSGGPGVGDGTHGLRVEARAGWRTRYVEPYGAAGFEASWPVRSRELFDAGGQEGYARTLPPRRADVTLGAGFVPWEDPERAQRVTLDVRLEAAWVSAGRAYSPLFDALGTSSHGQLAAPSAPCAGCVADLPFEGLTDVDAHGRLGGSVRLELRAARYVRFSVGTDLGWATPHAISGTPRCREGVDAPPTDPRRAGCAAGLLDPHHRSALDLPGHRFRVVDELLWRLLAEAVAQF